jgi:hypothetical protein
MAVNEALNMWLNVTTLLVVAGALFYVTLGPYMTED